MNILHIFFLFWKFEMIDWNEIYDNSMILFRCSLLYYILFENINDTKFKININFGTFLFPYLQFDTIQ